MSNIQVSVGRGQSVSDRQKLSEAVDQEIQFFDDWFLKTYEGNAPLAQFEKSIIKTYLMFKLLNPPKE